MSKSRPPSVAPSMMASWTTATSRPPPASASCGSVRESHVHQPTGAAVPTSPHIPSRDGGQAERAAEENEGHGDQRHQSGNDGERAVKAFLQEPPDQRRADEAGGADEQEQERKRAGADARHVFEERAQIGKERELPHEEECRRGHA